MENQKHLFDLPVDIHYLNCAYMSPQLKSVTEAGIRAVRRKSNPSSILPADFFSDNEKAKSLFGEIVGSTAHQVAIIPSVSYGIQSALQNIPCRPGQYGMTISKEFPSGYFSAKRWSESHDAELIIIEENKDASNPGKDWNERILSALTQETAFIVLSSVHWVDGTKFDLQAIGNKCRQTGTALIVDGTQSVGALPIDVKKCHIDALICGAYKWLMSPYSLGFAYFGERFAEGIPLEESWMNRTNSEEFSSLTNYDPVYKPGAYRYNVGQSSHFIQIPMAIEALKQIVKWQPENIQAYCKNLTAPLIDLVQEIGGTVAEEAYRAHHLVGLKLPENIDPNELVSLLKKKNLILSLRGNSIRISPNVYNTEEDIEALMSALKELIQVKV